MEFTKLIQLWGSKIREDQYLAMEYLKGKYPEKIPESIKALLYYDIGNEIVREYCDAHYSSDSKTFFSWKVSWKIEK